MVTVMRNPLSRIPPFLLLAAALVMLVACGEESAGGFDGAVQKQMEDAWNSQAEIHLTIKDPEGNPLTAQIVVSTFAAAGREGVGGGQVLEANGTALIEFDKIVWAELKISKEGYDNELLDFDFTDLEDPWERAADGRTIIIRRDVVLTPFTERPRLSNELFHTFDYTGDLYGEGFSVIRRSSEVPAKPWVIKRIPVLEFDSDTSATVYVEYQDNVVEAGLSRRGDGMSMRVVFPEGKKIVLRMHSINEEDGFIFPGIVDDGIGNHLPLAPEGGYTKSFVLEKEWFVNHENSQKGPLIYVKAEGVYSKLWLQCFRGASRPDFPDMYPIIRFSMYTNLDGGRNLRTTW